MSKAALAWIDHCQDDTDGVPELNGNSGTSALAYDSAYPGHNAITEDSTRVARVDYTRNGSANLDITMRVQFSASDDKTMRVLAAINCRLPSDVVQVTAAAVNSAGTVLETGTTFTAAQLVLAPRTTDRYDLFWILAQDQIGARAYFNFRFPASTSGYFEVGRLWAGPAIVWPDGVGATWALGGVDGSNVVTGAAGGFSASRHSTRKTFDLDKQGLSYIEALGDPDDPDALNLRQFVLEAGMSYPVIAISSDATQHKAQALSTYGRVTSMPSISNLGVQRFGAGLQIEQAR